MIEALKLKNHKGVVEIDLIDLRHINVLSGMNNSGKSSILEAINDSKKRSVGVMLNEADLDNLAKIYHPFIQTSHPSRDQIISALRVFIIRHQNQYLYKDGAGAVTSGYILEFIEFFNKMNRSNFGGDFGFPRFLGQIFGTKESSLKTCLIDPKRKIEDNAKIDTATQLSTNGGNLLNHLFYLKNQDPYSEEYKTYKNIFDSFSKITNGTNFNVLPDKSNNILLQFRTDSAPRWINAGDCGLGLREVLMIVTFVFHPEFNFIQIEEPENHLHPTFQRRLLEFIFTSGRNKQFLLSTHSNIFLDASYVDKIFWVTYDGKVSVKEETNKARILNQLGYSTADNLTSDLIILTEGPKDFPVIEEFLKKMDLWDKYDIKFWHLGGDTMSQIDVSFLKDNYSLIALIDQDPKSKPIREKFKKQCEDAKVECFQLDRYAIENYFTVQALKNVFKGQIGSGIAEIKPDISLEDQININVKKNSRKIAEQMNLDEIKGTDFYQFLVRVGEILKNTQ